MRSNVLIRMFYVKGTAKHNDENIIINISLTLISNLQICNYLKRTPKHIYNGIQKRAYYT